MKKFLAQFLRSATRQPLPFKPLATINVPSNDADLIAPQRPMRSVTTRANGLNRSNRHTNQLSS